MPTGRVRNTDLPVGRIRTTDSPIGVIRATDFPIGRIRTTDLPAGRISYAVGGIEQSTTRNISAGTPIGLLLTLTYSSDFSITSQLIGKEGPIARIRNTD